MKFSHFFIDRPIFAIVLSLIVVVSGGIALFALPISEYPSVVPPTVIVRGVYPGANPKVIAETVAAPLEQQLNGVDGLLYMYSQSTSDGAMTLTATFALGTDIDNGAGAGPEPRRAGTAALAAGGSAHRRRHGEGVTRLPHGRAPRVARRALRHAVPVELSHTCT